MRKNRFVSIAFAVVVLIATSRLNRSHAQDVDPRTWPAVTATNLQYLGAFRVPSDTRNNQNFSGSDGNYGKLALGATGQSLYLSNANNYVAEINIPEPLIISNYSEIPLLPVAQFIQDFQDPSETHWGAFGTADPEWPIMGGMLFYNNKLLISGYTSYDNLPFTQISHATRSPNLSTQSFSGWSTVWRTDKAGMVSGNMSPLPTAWHSWLGDVPPAVEIQRRLS